MASRAVVAGSESESESVGSDSRRRCGGVIRLKADKYDAYRELHAAVWPQVLDRIYRSNIRNYVIYYCKELGCLFSHFEYVGTDFDADMKAIADDPVTREWWKVTEPCQEPLSPWQGPLPSEGGTGAPWWTPMEELFHSGTVCTQYSTPTGTS